MHSTQHEEAYFLYLPFIETKLSAGFFFTFETVNATSGLSVSFWNSIPQQYRNCLFYKQKFWKLIESKDACMLDTIIDTRQVFSSKSCMDNFHWQTVRATTGQNVLCQTVPKYGWTFSHQFLFIVS